jgi:uncharacterized protein (TIGR00251 family)
VSTKKNTAGSATTAAGDTCEIRVKVTPNAKRSEIIGRLGDAWKIRLQAPPVDGKANKALTEFLAEKFSIRRDAVVLLAGASSHDKRIRLIGISPALADTILTTATPP